MYDIPEGFLFSAINAEIKYKNRDDLALIFFPNSANVSAVFTKNRVKAAPVIYCKNLLKGRNKFKAIVINSGNANACTGEQGLNACKEICNNIAEKLKITRDEVLISSTGVIGVQLPILNFIKNSENLVKKLSKKNIESAARAIMTTDSFPKINSVKKDNYTICGIAKGAGMINPDMATMLAFILTDAFVEKDIMDKILKNVVDKTFNSITVDGDMSTNDSVFFISTGINKEIDIEKFENDILEVCFNLAKMIVKDGEGATKLIKIRVKNGASEDQCRRICESIANSLLVKTAMFGGDPNWGRILAAIGYSGEIFNPENIIIYLGENKIVENGMEAITFSEKKCAEYLRENREIEIIVDLNQGDKFWDYFTCDISYDYVKINAEYRT